MYGKNWVVENGNAAAEKHGTCFAGCFVWTVARLYDGDDAPNCYGDAQELVIAVRKLTESECQKYTDNERKGAKKRSDDFLPDIFSLEVNEYYYR